MAKIEIELSELERLTSELERLTSELKEVKAQNAHLQQKLDDLDEKERVKSAVRLSYTLFDNYMGCAFEKLGMEARDKNVFVNMCLGYKNKFTKDCLEDLIAPLTLKPIESISDSDAINMQFSTSRPYKNAREFLQTYKAVGFLTQREADYLRANGYAVPFMNYTVKQMEEFGWITLENN